ncbi:MAG TPA: hypothetical protein VMR14_22255 [Streptosporangiaceae bacterium]|jgi:NAD(P)H-dependent FMN reductase|nr:hypothetical protein [Streptosporangiaceae bacterium]
MTAPNSPRQPIKILIFAASLRRSSLNSKLAELAAAAIEASGGQCDLAGMRELDRVQ